MNPKALRQSLEAALVENPADLAAHSAYADFLMEQGDARGEFVQVQLALEDESRPAVERKTLRLREAELVAQHAKEWLGETRRFLVGNWCGPDKPWRYAFRRGWLDHVRMLCGPARALQILAKSPEARLLNKLEIVYDMRYHPFDFDEWVQGPMQELSIGEDVEALEAYEILEDVNCLETLEEAPHLGNLRSLTLGFSDDEPDDIRHSTMVRPFANLTADGMIGLLEGLPRLEELRLNYDTADVAQLFASPALGNLQVFQYYFGIGHYRATASPYPLEALAGNTALTKLRELRLHPGRDAQIETPHLERLAHSPNLPALESLQARRLVAGDDAARVIVQSGILRRLKSLDLGTGNLTDAGAALLADAAGIRSLQAMNVTRNALTSEGVRRLQAVVPHVVADHQHNGDGYLYEVDVE